MTTLRAAPPIAALAGKNPKSSFTAGEDPVDANALRISKTFPWQSYFDTTALQAAIVTVPSNTPIILPEEHQYPAFALTLHPSSQVPVAVTCRALGTQGNSPVYVLVPGQTITPFGNRKFRSFKWGLPFGWLGGGIATLKALQNPYEPESSNAQKEIPYHRARFPILQASQLTSVAGANNYNNAPLNWPGRFPWINAFTNVNGTNVLQAGNPGISPEPTKIIMTLRGLTTLASPAQLVAVIQGSDEFSLDNEGTPLALSLTNPVVDPLPAFPAFNTLATSGNLSAQNVGIVVDSTHPLVRLACDSAGVVFVDNTVGSVLQGCYVDIVRYGRL